jgi:hypothetical protein
VDATKVLDEKEREMFAVFNWGPVYTAGGYNEHVSAALNKWQKETPNAKVVDQDVKVLPAGDGQRYFLTIVVRYEPK